jgi:hypothetical protein
MTTYRPWAHPVVLAWREVFGRRHPAYRHLPRSRGRDVRHAAGHLRAWGRALQRGDWK